MSDRPLMPSWDEMTVPFLISRADDTSPVAEQWKRDHPDSFVAGHYDYPPEERLDPNGPPPPSDGRPLERSIAPIVAGGPKRLRPTARDVGVPAQQPASTPNAYDDADAPDVRLKASDDVPIHDARHARRRPPVTVGLPDGSTVEQIERNGHRGPMVAPYADLSDVAAAGRTAGE